MKKYLPFILLCCIGGIAFAQTAQQAQLLQSRIDIDTNSIIADQYQINQDTLDIASRQTDIGNLNAEIQGAEAFLNMIANQPIVNQTNTDGTNWSSNQIGE